MLERIHTHTKKTQQTLGLRNLSFEDSLKRLNMFFLHKEGLGRDLMVAFKILNRFKNINPDSVIQRECKSITHGNDKVKRTST